jgi:hypothetical protein
LSLNLLGIASARVQVVPEILLNRIRSRAVFLDRARNVEVAEETETLDSWKAIVRRE